MTAYAQTINFISMGYMGTKAQGFFVSWLDPLHMPFDLLRFSFTVSPFIQNTFLSVVEDERPVTIVNGLP